MLAKCPRCKKHTLDRTDCGESSLYGSFHEICEPCFHDEYAQIEEAGTNDLPDVLAAYGLSNMTRR